MCLTVFKKQLNKKIYHTNSHKKYMKYHKIYLKK